MTVIKSTNVPHAYDTTQETMLNVKKHVVWNVMPFSLIDRYWYYHGRDGGSVLPWNIRTYL